MLKQTVLSCIMPTGEIHLGNYLGAIANWKKLQSDYTCFFGIVDYHALTDQPNPVQLRANRDSMLIDLVACGIEPNVLFIQSRIPEHTELAWILGCQTSYGELSRMTQFKDKKQNIESLKNQKTANCGLFTYPVLQAADILLYHSNLIPVGKDQVQHLELTRNIAERFNHFYNTSYFSIPHVLLTEIPKVMSLSNSEKKMSKSFGSKHYIGLFENDLEEVKNKITGAVTDENGVDNLMIILKAFCIESYKEFNLMRLQGILKNKDLKDKLLSILIPFLENLSTRKSEVIANKEKYLDQVYGSTEEIRKTAIKTIREVKQITGLY
ncbi:MAG: tryptophan--tRNA ligase [Chitinophagaceae bacterium]